MVGVTKVAITNSIPDALSIASIASANNEPILITDKDAIPTSVGAYLASTTGSAITSSDVIGGTGVISDAVESKFPSPTRHWGNTEYFFYIFLFKKIGPPPIPTALPIKPT